MNAQTYMNTSCVISSFITKPQRWRWTIGNSNVALYPLSSPNHNKSGQATQVGGLRYILFHHQTTTSAKCVLPGCRLRYILFHHQTTTPFRSPPVRLRCVISSFITKPQLCTHIKYHLSVALYPLSSPNHNLLHIHLLLTLVALYPLSSPNHNFYLIISK